MRTLLLGFMLAGAGLAQTAYTSTSGEITLSVMPWSTTVVPTAVSEWRPVPVSGTWITACTSNQSTRSMKAIISHQSGPDVITVVQDFGQLSQSRCGNVLALIKKESIINVSIVTASADFHDIR
jgi:hypothetical protein